MTDRDQLERAIAAQLGLRGVIDDEVIDVTVASLRARLASIGSIDQRRRQATVLFADVQGFTALAETLDAEVVNDIMNDVWSRLDRIVTLYSGRIDKHIGDAIMAVWGAESSHESDPENAVRAGLELQRALAALNEASGRSLVMRVGVSTGAVVLGEVATTREFTAMGDTVNVAARLEHAAPASGVLVSHDTYRHVRGVFDVSPLEALHVKGREQPVRAYLVHRAKPRTFRMATRGVEGVETRMVGRDTELRAVCTAFERVVQERTLRVVAIVGDAGVGKSRLLYEFENWVELLAQEVYFLKARAMATRQNVPHGVFRDLVAARFSILDSDSPVTVAAKVRAGFAPHLAPAEADLVGHWLGFDLSSTEAVRRLQGSTGFASACTAHLTRFLRSLASVDPVLIVIEDLHWADSESLHLLDSLSARLLDTATCVVGATRPVLLEERRELVVGVATELVQLAPLGDDTTKDLVAEVLQHVGVVPPSLTELIVERADGNPFFVEELIKMLIDDRVIVPAGEMDAWTLDLDRLDSASVPSTLTGVLESRLDSLEASHRDALQRASVVGRVFWDAAISAMQPLRPHHESAAALDEACARELIFRRDHSAIDEASEFIFKHALLRDVTYETVLLRDRQQLHALAAEWLSINAGDRLSEFSELIAEHHQLAGSPAAAADLYFSAGRRALAAGRSAGARRSLDRAMSLWAQASVEPPGQAVLLLVQACLQSGDVNAAEVAIEPLLHVTLAPESEAMALYFASWIAGERNDHVAEKVLLDRCVPIAEGEGGTVLARVLVGVALVEADEGDLEAAEAAARRALAVVSDQRESTEYARALLALATVARLAERYDEDERILREVLELARRLGDLEMESAALGDLGVVLHLVGDKTGSMDAYRSAEAYYLSLLETSANLGNQRSQALFNANLAQLYLRLDRAVESRAPLDRALRSAVELGRRADLNLCLLVEADLRLVHGDVAGALSLLGAVQTDPGLVASNQQEIRRVLSRAMLRDDEVDAGMAVGRHRDLVEIAHELLGDTSS